MKRRTWLFSALGGVGALVVGWGVMPMRSRLGSPELMLAGAPGVALNGWIKISPDGTIVLAMARSEMGQGVHTALPMLVAEELEVPLNRVRIDQAGADTIYGNVAMLVGSLPFHPSEVASASPPTTVKLGEWIVGKAARELGINATGGSSSVADAWDVLRMAAATVRASLVGAAAKQWRVPTDEIMVKDGVLSHSSGKSAGYGEMAKFAVDIAPGTVALRERKDWKVIGRAAPRLDLPSKVNGSAIFGIDVRLPGMVFAAVRMNPELDGLVGAIDSTAAQAMPGVLRVVPLGAFAGSTAGIAAVAKTYWHAAQAVQAVKVQWLPRPQGALETADIQAQLGRAIKSVDDGHVFYDKGSVVQAEAAATRIVESTYFAPYLAHATMEPMNCTAQVKDGKVEIWAPTQVPQIGRAVAAKVAGVPIEQVVLHVTLLGGGFGRRLEVDFIAQAVQIAMTSDGKPVQMIWSREEDMTHDFYRPMQLATFRAGVDSSGAVTSLRVKSAGDAISPRAIARAFPAVAGPFDAPDKTASEGIFDLPYGFAHQRMSHVATRSGVPIGFWRSVGHSHNAFFSESFIDELAVEIKQDSLTLRRSMLKDAPRHLAVLNLAAQKADWGSKPALGRARGIALHESFGSIVAQVVEASIVDGHPKVHRVVCAVDCGVAVNSGIIAQQMESAVVFALSAALFGQIDIVKGVVQQVNFPIYQVVKLADAPVVETWIIASERSPGGIGEPGVPPLAPALGSALFALTGKRLKALPFRL